LSEFDHARRRMVERQIQGRGIHDPRVIAAMLRVPREEFVAPRYADLAYDDAPLPIDEGQTISQPYIVAFMAEAAEIGPGDRVLEVGTGSGYAAAVLSHLARDVYTVERFASLASQARGRLAKLGYTNVHVLHGDGMLGWPEHAPFDAILVAAAGLEVPPALRAQLAVGGRLVIPVGPHVEAQQLVRVRRRDAEGFHQEFLADVRFVPLVPATG
jgi:protein-L-isoaspartate(D-aspartate) O-methyltransferase